MTAKILPPKLSPQAILELIDVHRLAAALTFEGVCLSEADASRLRAVGLSFDESTIKKVSFTEAHLEKLALQDSVLTACDLSAAGCSSGSYIRTRFAGGRMTGADFSRSGFQDVVFENCKLDLANFRFAACKRVRFVNCLLAETDFQGAKLTDVSFENCRMEKTEFSQCALKNADARSSYLFDIRGWQSLRGLVIDPAQLTSIAPELALELGLVVRD